jgi:hypothetical protein
VAKTLFESIGRRLGQKVAQAKNAFDLMGGTEEDSLRAEIRLGRDLEAALLERIPLVEENETTRFGADWVLAGGAREGEEAPFQCPCHGGAGAECACPPRWACFRELAVVGNVPGAAGRDRIRGRP